MADIQTISEAMAGALATLRDDVDNFIGQVSPYLLDSPTPPSVMVAGVDDFTMLDFGENPSVQWTILVSAVLGDLSDKGSQRLLNRLLAPSGSESLVAVLEADQALTKRLNADGTVSTGQSAAANSIAFSEFRGQISPVLDDGTRVLVATWAFEVIS